MAMDQTIVYFGTGGGVIRYDRFANRWLDPMTQSDGIPDNRIENIAYDPDFDRIYVQTPLGAAYYQPAFQQWYLAAEFPIKFARNDYQPGSLGILSAEFGYSYQNGQISDLNFRSYQLTRGRDDGFNHLYVGTWGLGPAMINTRYGDLKLMPFGPYSQNSTALVRLGDSFWSGGGFGGAPDPGITRFDTALQSWKYFVPRYTDGLASSKISCGLSDGKITWLGTDYGVARYDSSTHRFVTFADFTPLPSVEVTALAADSIWIYVGTANGLGYLGRDVDVKHRKGKHKNEQSDSQGVDSSEANSPLSSKNRLLGWHINNLRTIGAYLYIAGDRGALRRPLGGYGDFEYVNTPEKMLSTEIYDIAGLGDSLFFLTKNDIIVIDTTSGKTSSITDPSFFGQWRMSKFIVDKDNIWAATNLGLWKYHFSDGARRLFTTADGMVSSDIKSIELLGDYIWMATPQGVIRFLWNRPGRID